jgi:hypothetical protein
MLPIKMYGDLPQSTGSDNTPKSNYSVFKLVTIATVSVTATISLIYYLLPCLRCDCPTKFDGWMNHDPTSIIQNAKLVGAYTDIRDFVRDGLRKHEVLPLVDWLTVEKDGEGWGLLDPELVDDGHSGTVTTKKEGWREVNPEFKKLEWAKPGHVMLAMIAEMGPANQDNFVAPMLVYGDEPVDMSRPMKEMNEYPLKIVKRVCPVYGSKDFEKLMLQYEQMKVFLAVDECNRASILYRKMANRALS